MFKVNVYYTKRIIDLTISIPGVKNWNLPMNTSEFKIYKGSKNSLELVVRNNDRKPVNLIGKQLIITITDKDTYTQLIQKPLVIQEAYAGSSLLVLESYEIENWPLGYLRYTVMMQHEDGSQSMLYIEQDQGSSGFFELLEGPNIGPVESILCNTFISELNQNNIVYYYSTSFPGNAQIDPYDHNLMTVALYTTNFTGTIFFQGCLEDAVPTINGEWFPLSIAGSESLQLSNFTGITPLSFEASLRWMRVIFTPDPDFNEGTFDQILYRN